MTSEEDRAAKFSKLMNNAIKDYLYRVHDVWNI